MAILAGLAACQSAAPAAARHAPLPSVTAARHPVATSQGVAGAGTDVRACRGGKCRISVTAPATIPVDARFGFRSIRVSVNGSEVTVAAAIAGGSLDDTVSVPGTAALNNLDINVQAIAGHRVTLEISPGK